jgi:hypothetical protein
MILSYESWGEKKTIVTDENRGKTFQFLLIYPKDTDVIKIATELKGGLTLDSL